TTVVGSPASPPCGFACAFSSGAAPPASGSPPAFSACSAASGGAADAGSSCWGTSLVSGAPHGGCCGTARVSSPGRCPSGGAPHPACGCCWPQDAWSPGCCGGAPCGGCGPCGVLIAGLPPGDVRSGDQSTARRRGTEPVAPSTGSPWFTPSADHSVPTATT